MRLGYVISQWTDNFDNTLKQLVSLQKDLNTIEIFDCVASR